MYVLHKPMRSVGQLSQYSQYRPKSIQQPCRTLSIIQLSKTLNLSGQRGPSHFAIFAAGLLWLIQFPFRVRLEWIYCFEWQTQMSTAINRINSGRTLSTPVSHNILLVNKSRSLRFGVPNTGCNRMDGWMDGWWAGTSAAHFVTSTSIGRHISYC